MNSILPVVRSTAKALVALVVCAAAYLVGILSGDQNLTDVRTVQWLGLIVFMGGAYGITYAIPNRPGPPVQVTGTVTSQTTGETASIDATIEPDEAGHSTSTVLFWATTVPVLLALAAVMTASMIGDLIQ